MIFAVSQEIVIRSNANPILWDFLNPLSLLRNLYLHKNLIWQFSKRETESRYRGSYLGIVWSFLTPFFMLLVFTFVFGIVFKARWGDPNIKSQSLAEFALIMFSGQIAFQLFSEPVSRASTLIVSVPNFVKKIVFPIQILPVVIANATVFQAAVSCCVLCVLSLFIKGSLPWTIVLIPVALIPMLLMGVGVSWFVSALGVYVRDINFVVNVCLQLLYYSCPIFYSIHSVPIKYQAFIANNPLTPGIELIRSCLVLGIVPPIHTWVFGMGIGIVVAIAGYAWFMMTKRGFADVL